MAGVKPRRRSTAVERARERRRCREQRRKKAQRQKIARIALLCTGCLLLGGAAGGYLGVSGYLGGPVAATVALQLDAVSPAEASTEATQPAPLITAAAPIILPLDDPIADEDASLEREALEAAFLQSYDPLRESGEDRGRPGADRHPPVYLAAIPASHVPEEPKLMAPPEEVSPAEDAVLAEAPATAPSSAPAVAPPAEERQVAAEPSPVAAQAKEAVPVAAPSAAPALAPAAEERQVAALTPALMPVEPPLQPRWQEFSVPILNPRSRPMIAIVLDDVGLNRRGAQRAIGLPGPLTLAFMTYAEGLERMTERASEAGHELLLHVPMEPRSKSHDPGPNVLLTGLDTSKLQRRIEWGLGRFEGFVGISNHMGSRFTTSHTGMTQVMHELRARGLLFLDSMTATSSVGASMARAAGVPYAQRDVFLDNEWNDREAIRRQLARLEAVARRRGYAVGIGHPHRATLDVLTEWLPEAEARGFALVPVSAIVRHRFGIAQDVINPKG